MQTGTQQSSGSSERVQVFDYDYSWDANIFLSLVMRNTSVFIIKVQIGYLSLVPGILDHTLQLSLGENYT